MLKTIWQTIVFYGACTKWAAHGTLEIANAWFWLVGLPAVAIIGAYLGFGELRVPDNPPEFIAFMLVTVFATWIVFFAIRLLLAPAHLYEEAKQVYEEAKQATAIAQTANVVLSERLEPKIKLFLNETTRGVALAPTETPNRERGPNSRWVQFDVACATDATLVNCEAWLTSAYRVNAAGKATSEQLVEEDTNLHWSQLSELKITISPGRVQRANLFSIYETPLIIVPQTAPLKIRLGDAIQTPGRYRLNVLVTAQDAPSRAESFLFEWLDFESVTLRPWL